jgi:ABC-type methionine transport system permease subunit
MLESTSLIIFLTFVIAFIIGIIIGRLLFKSSSENVESEHKFHVDSATGIVSDVTYQTST